MRIFADENVPRPIVEGLRSVGHDVSWGCDSLHGAPDVDRAATAYSEGRIILTEDNDFAAIVLGQGHPTHGIVRIDLHGFSRDRRTARVLQAMADIGDAAVGAVTVIEPARIRSRLTKP